ncbi:hypothetical protein VmeM32_00245 [Vibrio phage vB_VmeM-32]|nr:hypothetical protein VmeM32_00245 [Vibrio phage vB_VmeM-32]
MKTLMRDLETLTEILENLETHGRDPQSRSMGICSRLHCETKPYFRKWSHFSGNYGYPVPSTDERSPMCMYNDCDNMWDLATEYGQLRVDLLKHIIAEMTRQIEILKKYDIFAEYESLFNFLNLVLPTNRTKLVDDIYSTFVDDDEDELTLPSIHPSKFTITKKYGVCWALMESIEYLDLENLFEYMGLDALHPIESSLIYNKSVNKWDTIERIKNRVNFLYEIRDTLANLARDY